MRVTCIKARGRGTRPPQPINWGTGGGALNLGLMLMLLHLICFINRIFTKLLTNDFCKKLKLIKNVLEFIKIYKYI